MGLHLLLVLSSFLLATLTSTLLLALQGGGLVVPAGFAVLASLGCTVVVTAEAAGFLAAATWLLRPRSIDGRSWYLSLAAAAVYGWYYLRLLPDLPAWVDSAPILGRVQSVAFLVGAPAAWSLMIAALHRWVWPINPKKAGDGRACPMKEPRGSSHGVPSDP